MKYKVYVCFCIIVIIAPFLLFLFSCTKEEMSMLPELKTEGVINMSDNRATCMYDVYNKTDYTILSRGVCWSTSPNPTVNNSITIDTSKLDQMDNWGFLTSSMSGLIPGTTYYVRAYAINSKGCGYGNQISFQMKQSVVKFNQSLNYGIVTDIEGNDYKTIVIGNQNWMAENLRTTKYNDGSRIPYIEKYSPWGENVGYCWYDNDSISYKSTYGALYCWSAENADKYCPTGWHVPNDNDWMTLINYLSHLGHKALETGSDHWLKNNQQVTNESGFTALPGGMRILSGMFMNMGSFSYWWSSSSNTNYSIPIENGIMINGYTSYGNTHGPYGIQMSIRCVENDF